LNNIFFSDRLDNHLYHDLESDLKLLDEKNGLRKVFNVRVRVRV
jgi:hypothetical protein